jgi:hypothetical protein
MALEMVEEDEGQGSSKKNWRMTRKKRTRRLERGGGSKRRIEE